MNGPSCAVSMMLDADNRSQTQLVCANPRWQLYQIQPGRTDLRHHLIDTTRSLDRRPPELGL